MIDLKNMRKTFEHGNSQGNIEFELILLYASQLAICGLLDEAEAVIKEEDKILSSSPQALDILARIAVKKGYFNQAEKLWQTALALEPNNEAIQEALACIGGPWLVHAMLRRLSRLAVVALIIALALAEIMAIFPPMQLVKSFCDSLWISICQGAG